MNVRAPKILILAGDTDGNLGDLAILTAVCRQLRLALDAPEICILSSRPRRDRKRLGVVTLRRGISGIPSVISAARKADLVICGGGGLFQDDDSLVKMPYWAFRLSFLRLFSKRIAGLSIGAGPLNYPVSRYAAGVALRTLETVSVRDELAKATLSNLTTNNVTIVPDPGIFAARGAARRCD